MRLKIQRKSIAVAVGALVLGAAVAPWSLSGQSLRREIASQVRNATGLEASFDGRTVLALLPRPRVKIENVTLRDRGGNLRIEAAQVHGELRLLPMLAGRLELASATLASPRLSIDLDHNPFAGGGLIARAVENAPDAADAAARLGVLSLTGGSARLKSSDHDFDVSIENIDATIDWRSLGSPAGLKGSFELNGERANVALWLASPLELLRGKSSDMSLKLAAPDLALDLDGALASEERLVYTGSFSATSPGLRALPVAPLRGLPLPGRLEALSLTGAARIQSNSLALGDARLTVDGNAYEGALAVERERGRALLSGTLATNSLDVAPLLASAPALFGAGGNWSRAPFPASDRAMFDVDVRVSATNARVGRISLRDAAFSMLLNRDGAEFSIAEAGVFNGVVKSRLTARRKPSGYDLGASMSLAGVSSALLTGEAFRGQRLNGQLDGVVALSSEGETIAAAAGALRGEANFQLGQGDFSGLDLELALRRLEKRPLSIASDVRNGRTGFDAASIDLKVENGVAGADARGRGPGVEFSVTGAVDIAGRSLDLKLLAKQATPASPGETEPRLSMEIAGPWNEPRLTLDARGLISRSPAAAPLLRGLGSSALAPAAEPR